MSIKQWVLMLCTFSLLAVHASASTEIERPLDAVKGPIDQIINILNDPTYQEPNKKGAQRDKIWEIARPMFAFDIISRRAVGKPWAKFSLDEKNRFTDVFSEFLGSSYIDKMQGEFHNEKILFGDELIRGSKALVRTKLMRESLAISIDYKMKQIDGAWKIYDILVESGVSLVKNYRVQFNSILRDQTPAQLISRLEKKLAEQQTTSSTKK